MDESNVWNETPLWSLGKTGVKKNTGMKEDNLLSLSYGNIVRKNINSQNGLIPDSYETYQIVSKNDIIFRFTDLQNDKKSLRSAIVKERGIITSAYTKLTPNNKVFPNFLSYSMRSKDHNKEFYKMGSGVRQSLNWEEFSQMRIPLPPLETQQRIADYLDRETAQIDDNVSNLNAYIDLLKQRRQVLITDAVTGRIDSNGNRVEGGQKWDMVPVGMIGKIVSGGTPNPNEVNWKNGTIPFITPADMGSLNGGFVESVKRKITEEGLSSGSKSVKRGVIISSRAPVGYVALIKNRSAFNQGCKVLITDQNNKFISYVLLSMKKEMNDLANGTTFLELPSSSFAKMRIPLPPLETQQRIADFLDKETAEIDALIEDSTRLRDLLLKRRQVMITEVVTGKKEV